MSGSTLPPAGEKAAFVNRMFAQIADQYDLANRLITAGQDAAWRRKVIELCQLPLEGRFLDVGTGTGDIAFEAGRTHPDAEVIGCDFTYEMMAVGRKKSERASWRTRWETAGRVEFVQGDAMQLPFADDYFDAVASGFLLRNVTDVDICLAEQRRVTKQGGRIVCLETSPPPQSALTPLLRFYMFRVIPVLGQLVASGGRAATRSLSSAPYHYLPASTAAFLPPREMGRRMAQAGFRHVSYLPRMFGTVAIYVGIV